MTYSTVVRMRTNVWPFGGRASAYERDKQQPHNAIHTPEFLH